jgi:uncharacterized membrane protein YfcA
MYYSYAVTLSILCPFIFLSSFIDAIAGGGGLISLPAYIFVGIPIHNAYATNKFSASLGTAMAVANYLKGDCIDFTAGISGSVAAVIGSFIGTQLALSLSPRALQICLMVILPLVGVFIFAKRGPGNQDYAAPRTVRFKLIFSALIGLVFGCYDGFFGPGTGMFMTLALSGLVHLDLIKSVGTTKLINFASNFTAMITWLISGKILFPIAIPCMVCSVAGGFLGSRMVIKTGKKLIRLVLALVSILLFVKIAADLIKDLAIMP